MGKPRALIVALLLSLLVIASPARHTQAQSGTPGWTTPVNLSRSGAASLPVVVAGPDGTMRAFWWDQFDGLMLADGTIWATSTLSGTQEVLAVRASWSEPRSVPLEIKTTPQILADTVGAAYALWLQPPTSEQVFAAEGKPLPSPLVYSRLDSDGASWSPTAILADSAFTYNAAIDASGALHVAYVTTIESRTATAGIYYRRTNEAGTAWTVPVILEQSRYVRLFSSEGAHLQLAAAETGDVYITWDDPRSEELVLVHSRDGGRTWGEPAPLADPEAQARSGLLVPVPGGGIDLLWQDTRSGARCALYQAPASDLLDGAAVPGTRVLDGLVTCPEAAEFLPLAEGQVLMVAGGGTDSLTLALWGGEGWSETGRLSYSFEDPEMGRQVYLGDLRAALVRLPQPSLAEGGDRALVVVGTDPWADVWATNSRVDALDMVFAPPPPWSAPESFADRDLPAQLPVAAFDAEGRIHILWSEEAAGGGPGPSLIYSRRDEVATASGTELRWIMPTQILQSSDGGADQPALVAVGDRLHAVWRAAGEETSILYSQAYARDAYAASGWQEPQPLPGPAAVVSWPALAVDLGGRIHVAYAVPVNEGRGIYYTNSGDGRSWSEARQLFDAAGAGWAMSDYPRLDVDLAGNIHAVWVRADPVAGGSPQGIYYARSADGGETWSEALAVAEGAYAWPQVIASGEGQVHLLWSEAAEESAWWHQRSADGGLTWTSRERVPGFGDVPGPIGAVADRIGAVYLVGLGLDDAGEQAMLFTAWDGERWVKPEASRLDLGMNRAEPGVSAALLPASGRLEAIFRSQGKEAVEAMQAGLWHAGRAVPTVVAAPLPTFTPRPSPTPASPTPMPTAVSTPTPLSVPAPPRGSGGSVGGLLPLLLPGGLAVVIVAWVFGAKALRSRRGR